MFLKFNNNNIWEVVESGNDQVTFFRRVLTPHALRTVKMDEEINENDMSVENGYSYEDWKIFFGEERLKKLVVDFERERYVLPMIYFATFIKGLTDMIRERETKYVWKKRSNP